MKKLHQSFDVDIRSTQEKEKKFCRKGISPSPKTSSNKSDKSLSKFWVKNLRVSASGKSLETTIMLANQKNEEANLLRREGVRNKNELSGWGDYQKQQLVDKQRIQIKRLNIEIQKYRVRLDKQNQKLAQLQKRSSECEEMHKILEQKLHEKESKIKRLEGDIQVLNSKINQKDTLFHAVQKQPSHLSKIKTSILQTRVQEHEKQRERLQNQIEELQLQLLREKELNITSSFSYSSPTNNTQRSFSTECQQNDSVLRLELYQAKQELKKMQISATCNQRKHFKELQLLRQRKEKEYEELRKKYTQLLEKYRACIKKNTTDQIKNYKVKKQQSMRRPSTDSADSLALSSDSELKNEAQSKGVRV